MPSLINRNQANSSTPPPGGSDTPPPPSAPVVVPTLPLPAPLELAAQEFKKLFNDNGAAYHLTGGQGALTDVMRKQLVEKVSKMSSDPLKKELGDLIHGEAYKRMKRVLFHSEVRLSQKAIVKINEIKKSDPSNPDGANPDGAKLAGVLKTNSIVNTTVTYRKNTENARLLMSRASVADQALAAEVLDDKSANGQWVWNALGAWMGSPKLGPKLFDKVSLPRLLALAMNATVQCAPIASSTARKIYATRPPSADPIPPFAGYTFQMKASDTTLRPQDTDDVRSKAAGNDILRWNPAQLDAAMQSARGLLPKRFLVAGCLSGFRWENKKNVKEEDAHPFPEHYILIFAADNDTMLFWDPDATVTDIHEFGERLGMNIGLLYYDHSDPTRPTLSTGVDFTDLSTLSGGDHFAHRQRHRYQIATLAKA